MLMPRTCSWTRKQRWLIVAFVLVALGTFATVVWTYERYHRGPTDAVFVGTWEMQGLCMDCSFYLTFQTDHKVVSVDESTDTQPATTGRWYAGGEVLVIHYNTVERAGSWVMRIVDIAPDAIRLRGDDGGDVLMLRSAAPPPKASNQAMQRTAGRSAFPLAMTSTFNPQPRAPSPAVADLGSR